MMFYVRNNRSIITKTDRYQSMRINWFLLCVLLVAFIFPNSTEAQDDVEPIRVSLFKSALDKIPNLIYGYTPTLISDSSDTPLNTNLLSARFCGTSEGTARFRVVLGPNVAIPGSRPIRLADCKQLTSQQAKSIIAEAIHPDWVAVFDLNLHWDSWKFSIDSVSDSISVESASGVATPSITYFTQGIPTLAHKEISTENVSIGMDASYKPKVAIAAGFINDSMQLLISPSKDDIDLTKVSDESLSIMISSSPEFSNFIAKFPISTVNQIIARQPSQKLIVPQGKKPPIEVSSPNLTAKTNELHISGQYQGKDITAHIDSSWLGDDLKLSEIKILPKLENCSSGDADCLGRNAVANATAGAASTAYTVSNASKKFRPSNRENHDIVVEGTTITINTEILKSSTDGIYLFFFGREALME